MRKRLLCLFLTVCLTVPLAVPAAALTTAEKNANRQTIYSYLINTLGCNVATACGILANLEAESGFDPNASCVDTNKLISYGLCQWNGARNTQLRTYCAQNGLSFNTVTAQLQFMRYELAHNESAAWSAMQGFPNTSDGAYNAAYTWASKFERCAEVYYTQRAERARVIFAEFNDKSDPTPTTPAADLLSNVAQYTWGQFPDVSGEWFAPYVETAVRKGLMKGNDWGGFNPYGNMTIAEAVTIACRIFSRYNGDGEQFVRYGSHWYQAYMDYAYARQIIDLGTYTSSDPNVPVSRALFVQILSKTLPSSAFAAINSVSNNAISDVSLSSGYASTVYMLYRAGVLTGNQDAKHSFKPNDNIKRSEASAVLARMVVPSQRQSFSM